MAKPYEPLSKDEKDAAGQLLGKGWNTKDITACIVIARLCEQPVMTVATLFSAVDKDLNEYYLSTR